MRRTALLVALLLTAPLNVQAQLRLTGGLGVTNPMGDLGDAAGVGWHAAAGVRLGIATLPVGIHADGAYHSFGEESSNPKVSILSGALSLIVPFPGVGLRPYVLGGLGVYRTSVDVSGATPTSDTGIHGAFGVDVGGLGPGGFAEVRFVNISTDAPGSSRFVTARLGFRL